MAESVADENVLSSASKQPMFRAMKSEIDGFPEVGRSGRQLGVRVDDIQPDIPVDLEGMVDPRTGGMSIALDEARNLPKHRLPKSLGGEGRDPIFTMLTADVPESLFVRPDRYPHALVEPSGRCRLQDFEANLAGTRSQWSKTNE